MAYLLDTNALSDLVREPFGSVARRITVRGEANVRTSIIVAAELRFGVEKSGLPRIRDRVANVLRRVQVMPFESPADARYAQLRQLLQSAGTPIGGNDMFIAAHALALGDVLVTANLREFSRIDGLACENWLD